MVESLGYRIKRLFIGVFSAGSALAGLGGVMWGLYQQNVIPQMGAWVPPWPNSICARVNSF